MIEQHW